MGTVIVCSAWGHASATTRSSANYAIVNESFDSAGGQSSSANYTQFSNAGGIVGLASVVSPAETNNAGFAGQVTYVTGLQFAATYTPDGTTQAIVATQTLDDGTSQALAGTGASWTVISGQLPAGVTLDGTTGIITGTPTSVGAYSFTIKVADGLGDSALQTFTGTVTETFAAWEASYHISDAAGATPFHDGVPTLFKYLYNIDPTRPMTGADRAALPVVDYGIPTGQTTPFLTLTYRQYASQTGLVIQVQTSSDLITWTPAVQPGQPATPPDVTVPLGTDPVTGDPIIEVGVTPNGLRKQFIRLNVTLP